MQMEAVKAALKDLLAAMDSEDKRVLQAKLSGEGEKAAEPAETETEIEIELGPDGKPMKEDEEE